MVPARMPIAAEEARRGASGGNAMAVVMAAARTKAMVARAEAAEGATVARAAAARVVGSRCDSDGKIRCGKTP